MESLGLLSPPVFVEWMMSSGERKSKGIDGKSLISRE